MSTDTSSSTETSSGPASIGHRLLTGGEADATQFLDRFRATVSPLTGITRLLAEEKDYYSDEPKALLHRAEIAATQNMSSDGYPRRAAEGGRGFSATEADVGALFEGLERYSLSIFDRDRLTASTWYELDRSGVSAVRPTNLADHGAPGGRDRDVDDMTVHWVGGRSLLTGDECMVPAQTVYVPYYVHEPESYLRDPITTGAAAGLSWAGAARRGLFEVLERDALMMLHYRDITPYRLDADTFDQAPVDALLADLDRYQLDLKLFLVPNDIPVHVVVALVLDKSGVGPEFTLGTKASCAIDDAVSGAIFEAVCFRRGLRERLPAAREYAAQHLTQPSSISCLEDRTYYWCRPGALTELDYLSRADDEPALTRDEVPARTLREIYEYLGTEVDDAVVVDVTTSDVRELGVHVIKVVIPELQPMHLSETHRALTKRVMSERFSGSFDPARANRLPHPFL